MSPSAAVAEHLPPASAHLEQHSAQPAAPGLAASVLWSFLLDLSPMWLESRPVSVPWTGRLADSLAAWSPAATVEAAVVAEVECGKGSQCLNQSLVEDSAGS